MRKWIVGDIRGELRLVKEMLEKIGPTSSDTVVFLGSYMGPGQDSKGVLDLMIELRQKNPGVFLFLKGCYEFMFAKCIGEKIFWRDAELWGKMGGHQVMQSYSAEGNVVYLAKDKQERQAHLKLKIPAAHVTFLAEQLHQWFEDSTLPIIASHSGTHPAIFGVPECKEEEAFFTIEDWWTRDDIRILGKDIIFSHAPFPKPFIGKGKIGIDLGAGLSSNGRLCAYEAASQSFTIVGGR